MDAGGIASRHSIPSRTLKPTQLRKSRAGENARVQIARSVVPLALLAGCLAIASGSNISSGTKDGSEKWGYLDVRPGAHIFWWLYRGLNAAPGELTGEVPPTTPLIIWLQGGPGASGVGYGNFAEIGPLKEDLSPREHTWLHAGHLLFIDNPVGTGFSYADNASLLTTTNGAVIVDLVNFLRAFLHLHKPLRQAPLFVFCESYGGKFASQLAVAIHDTLAAGTLKLNFKGVALGDTWISPIDFLKVWGPQLRTLALLDDREEAAVNKVARTAEQAIAKGDWNSATTAWADMEGTVDAFSDNVDWYNVLLHNVDDLATSSVFMRHLVAHYADSALNLVVNTSTAGTVHLSKKLLAQKASQTATPGRHWLDRLAARGLARRHLARFQNDALDLLMNGPIKKKLGIIPDGVSWGMSSNAVFESLYEDFMKPTIDQVDSILEKGINITIYSGQLDLICCTDGTENWMRSLKWQGMKEYWSADRKPLYCSGAPLQTAAFVKKYKNLSFYWIMDAGHMVPADNPCMALKMVKAITGQA